MLGVAGILAAALAVFTVEYGRDHWVPPARWVGLTVYTVFGFGVIAQSLRRQWRELRLWLYLTALLLAHLAGYIVLLRSVDEWRLIWFLPMSLAEYPAVAHIMDMVMGRYEPVRRARRSG